MDKTGLEERLKKVSQEATRGNVDSIEELMKIASDLYEEKNFNLAAETFKDAAICYRIEGFRRKTKADSLEQSVGFAKEEIAKLKDWIKRSEQYKNFAPRWHGPKIEAKVIHDLFHNYIFVDPDCDELITKVKEGILRSSIELHWPGYTLEKVIIRWVLQALNSPGGSHEYKELEGIFFRLAFRQLVGLVISLLSDSESHKLD